MLQLKKFLDIPVSTQEEERESRPHPEGPRFRLLAREEGSFPCVVEKDFPAFPTHLKRSRSPEERREELQNRAMAAFNAASSFGAPAASIFFKVLISVIVILPFLSYMFSVSTSILLLHPHCKDYKRLQKRSAALLHPQSAAVQSHHLPPEGDA